jgi:hypothetical protein
MQIEEETPQVKPNKLIPLPKPAPFQLNSEIKLEDLSNKLLEKLPNY